MEAATPESGTPEAATPEAATPEPATPVERRDTSRTPVERRVTLRLADSGNLPPIPVRLVDVSAGGIGMRINRPLAPGKLFVLEVPAAAPAGSVDRAASAQSGGASSASGGDVFMLRYRVVRCKPLGQGEFHVGAEFLRTPAASPGPKSAASRRN